MASRSSFLFGHDPSGHARGHAFRKTGFHPRIKSEGRLFPDHALCERALDRFGDDGDARIRAACDMRAQQAAAALGEHTEVAGRLRRLDAEIPMGDYAVEIRTKAGGWFLERLTLQHDGSKFVIKGS